MFPVLVDDAAVPVAVPEPVAVAVADPPPVTLFCVSREHMEFGDEHVRS